MSKPIAVEKHPPERRRAAPTTAYCGCTCCCCCCLHSIGSLIGAAVLPVMGSHSEDAAHWTTRAMMPSDDDDGFPAPDLRLPSRVSAVSMFWRLSCVLAVLGLVLPSAVYGPRGETILISGIIVLLLFPAIQLVSVVVTMFVFLSWNRPDRSHQLKKLTKITGGVVLGSLAGVLVMAGIWGLFAVGHR